MKIFGDTIIVRCDYEEFKPETYQGMFFKDEKSGGEVRFKSDNPTTDLANCHRCAFLLRAENIMTSSSVENFFLDGRKEREGEQLHQEEVQKKS